MRANSDIPYVHAEYPLSEVGLNAINAEDPHSTPKQFAFEMILVSYSIRTDTDASFLNE